MADFVSVTFPVDSPIALGGPAEVDRLGSIYDSGGLRPRFVHRVWDTVAAGFVSWRVGVPDPTGIYYPGPGTFGVNTSDLCIERIKPSP
jgi:hypothetical protein